MSTRLSGSTVLLYSALSPLRRLSTTRCPSSRSVQILRNDTQTLIWANFSFKHDLP